MRMVYIPQRNPKLVTSTSGNPVPRHNFTSALEFGTLVELLPPGGVLAPDEFAYAVAVFFERLVDFDDDDFILATGDPALIGAATLVAGIINSGRVGVLRWDRRAEKYAAIQLDVPTERGV